MSFFLGIDNGLGGCVAVIETEQRAKTKITFFDTPTIEIKIGKKMRRRYSVNVIADFFKQFPSGDTFAIIETPIAMPGQSSMSSMSIGLGFGMYDGMMAMQRISRESVHPKKWQKEFSIAGDTKSQAFEIATRLFPDQVFSTPRGRILDGRCDAILIAEYACRKKLGELQRMEVR
jgi:hypothetical protein